MRGLLLVVFAAIMVYVVSATLEVECPTPLFGDISAAPHPCNCDMYYECQNGNKVARKCPWPFQFNREAQICDWPQRANCKIEPDCLKACQCTFST